MIFVTAFVKIVKVATVAAVAYLTSRLWPRHHGTVVKRRGTDALLSNASSVVSALSVSFLGTVVKRRGTVLKQRETVVKHAAQL